MIAGPRYKGLHMGSMTSPTHSSMFCGLKNKSLLKGTINGETNCA